MKARKTTNIKKIYTSEWELKTQDINIYFFLKKTYTIKGTPLQCNNIYIDITCSNQEKEEIKHTFSIEQRNNQWHLSTIFIDYNNNITWVDLNKFNTYREARNYIVDKVKNNFITGS